MKTLIQSLRNSSFQMIALIFFLSLTGQPLQAQTFDYSFPVWKMLQAGSAGLTLPDGTIVTATQLKINPTANIYPTSGGSGPNIGGIFDGTVMPGYTGSTDPLDYTRITTGNTQTIDNGIGTDCANGIAFHIHFSKPILQKQFLSLDLDGITANNAEWVSYLAFNGDVFVPYTQTMVTPNTENTAGTVTIGGTHNWRTMIASTISSAAAANIPATMPIARATNPTNSDPDNIHLQTLYTTSGLITDYYFMWGLWTNNTNVNQQNSGVSPIVVSVYSDFGRDPDSYKTRLVSGGPSHGVVEGISLGSKNYADPDGSTTIATDTSTDNDGLSIINPVLNDGSSGQVIASYTLTTTYINGSGQQANYVAWIDWNNNGQFEPSEGMTATSPAGSTSGSITFTWNNVSLIGAAGTANTYARIRMATQAMTTADAGGAFWDGEVEDYSIPFDIVLPVQVTYFKGSAQGSRKVLAWGTAGEQQTSHFEVEYSHDAIFFMKIGSVTAFGIGDHQYSFTDTGYRTTDSYYRLKMIDHDGHFSYSTIIRIPSGSSSTFSLNMYPNPVRGIVLVETRVHPPLTIAVMNSLGQIVIRLNGSNNKNLLDCSQLPAGVYQLLMWNGSGQVQRSSFIKQ